MARSEHTTIRPTRHRRVRASLAVLAATVLLGFTGSAAQAGGVTEPCPTPPISTTCGWQTGGISCNGGWQTGGYGNVDEKSTCEPAGKYVPATDKKRA